MQDLVIANGTIYDGNGKTPYEGHIVISGEKILDILKGADSPVPEARTVVNAQDCIVTPGFVDVHTHSEVNVLIEPNAPSKLRQGITTEITGNCGVSAFPLRGAMLEEARQMYAHLGVEIDWQTADEYFTRLESVKPAVNQAALVGHGNVRSCVVGMEDRKPDADEMAAMKREIEIAMEAGALGFSTGLIYAPGIFADTQELAELQKAAARRGGIYASHIRGEGDGLLRAADEFLDIVRSADCQGQFSHLKASGRRNWGRVEQVIERIERTNAEGGCVRFDKYPYIASGTELSSFLPRWMRDGGRDAASERLRDDAQRARMYDALRQDFGEFPPWDNILVVDTHCADLRHYNGCRIGQIARDTGRDSEEVCTEILLRSHLLATVCNFTMNQEETDRAILHPLGMLCSDSEIRSLTGPLAQGSPHPRAFGSFGKFFREYVKEWKMLPLEAAVTKVTSFPCDTFGFHQRGRLMPGYFADVLVIDFPAFRDRAEFADPCHYCEGVKSVVVNGRLTLHNGNYTGQRNGHALRRKKH